MEHLSCHLDLLLSNGVAHNLFFVQLAPVVFGVWDKDLGSRHLLIALCVSHKLFKSKSGSLYLYRSNPLSLGLGLALFHMCVQPKSAQTEGNELTRVTASWTQELKRHDLDAVSLLITDSLYLFVWLCFQTG